MARTPQLNAATAKPGPGSTLARVFFADVPKPDARPLTALWNRYLDHGAESDFHAIVETYAPLAFRLAWSKKKRNPDFYTDDVEDMISDACMGIMFEVRNTQKPIESLFRVKVLNRISKFMYRGVIERRWAKRHGIDCYSIARRERSRLTQAMGQVPSDQDVAEALRDLIHNPAFFSRPEPYMTASSQARGLRRDMKGIADPNPTRPEEALIDAEVMRLAGKGLDRQEKKILKLLLAGAYPKQIADKLNVPYSTLADRLNGVLWKARANAELAAYLGVAPCELPARTKASDWKYPKFDLPAAQRLAG